jgi:hypothetical protein
VRGAGFDFFFFFFWLGKSGKEGTEDCLSYSFPCGGIYYYGIKNGPTTIMKGVDKVLSMVSFCMHTYMHLRDRHTLG